MLGEGQYFEAPLADDGWSFRTSRMRRSAAGSAGAQQARPRVRREWSAASIATTVTKATRAIQAVMLSPPPPSVGVWTIIVPSRGEGRLDMGLQRSPRRDRLSLDPPIDFGVLSVP